MTTKLKSRQIVYVNRAQQQIVEYLRRVGRATRLDIVSGTGVNKTTISTHIGARNPETRQKNDLKYWPSLITLGLVDLEVMDIEGKDVKVFCLTNRASKVDVRYKRKNRSQVN